MKREVVTLTIVIDPSRKAGWGGYNWETREIVLASGQKHLELILAHELGHFMSDFLNTPIAKEICPKNISGALDRIKWFSPNLIKLEEEAWKFARAIWPEKVDEKLIEKYLDTYR